MGFSKRNEFAPRRFVSVCKRGVFAVVHDFALIQSRKKRKKTKLGSGMLIKQNSDTFMGGNCQNCFASLLKRVYSKRREFAPFGSKFFPFRVDPFEEWGWCAGKQK